MITLTKAHLAFGQQTVFNDISCSFGENERIGLVGRNGAGKSTLLEVLAGKQMLDGGTISIPKNRRIAYLPQEIALQSAKTVLEETLAAFDDLVELISEKERIECAMEKGHHDEKLLERYAAICHQLSEGQLEAKKAEAKKILQGLCFTERQINGPVAQLSGGWRMRIVLAKMLLKKADFYLFDEPTNHLDIVAKDWFLSFLQEADFGFIMVCHERYTLNKLAEKIFEIEAGNIKIYNGSFFEYEKQKEEDLKALAVAYEQQQREIKSKIATAERFKAKATKAAMAKSMLKKVENIERITLPLSPKAVNFKFDPVARAGRIVLTLKNVGQRFQEHQVFEKVNGEIERGERVALVAPNGVGKTTLFNLIIKKLPLQEGSIEYGSNVAPAIFEQDQDNWLDPKATILQNIQNDCPKVSEQKIRSLCGAFLFSGDDIDKRADVLSGGEKSRVGIIRLLLQGANFLLLDEPTNHLDILSKDILLNALQAYEGTMFFVSHDHDFINKLATRIIELHADGAESYLGNYDDFIYSKKQLQVAENKGARDNGVSAHKNVHKQEREQRKKIASLEKTIARLEQEKNKLEEQFAQLAYGTKEFEDHQKRFVDLQNEIETAFEQWHKLVDV